MNITIYTKSNCPNCVSAKALLKSKELEWAEYDLESFPTMHESLRKNFPDIRQMPAIWIDGQYVGGFAGLQAALKQLGL